MAKMNTAKKHEAVSCQVKYIINLNHLPREKCRIKEITINLVLFYFTCIIPKQLRCWLAQKEQSKLGLGLNLQSMFSDKHGL